jgi:23S rRNA (uracil1939-C5)-methyltransferase
MNSLSERAAMAEAEVVAIEALGARGDGVGRLDGKTVYVPGALPGETWQRMADGAFYCLEQTPERVVPTCSHFGSCGGCTVQHVPPGRYLEWKRDIVRQALRQHGIAAEPEAVVPVEAGTRRRCVLGAGRAGDGSVVLGYHRARSSDLISVDECPVLCQEIVAGFAGLRALCELLLEPGEEMRITVLAAREGLDVDLDLAAPVDRPELRTAMAELAKAWGIVRLAVGGEPLVMLTQPTVVFSGVSVPVPQAGTFLQAVASAEAEMVAAVVAGVGRAKMVADLFCGLGTFAFALARRSRVLAVDSERSAIAALEAGRNGAQGLKPITTKVRDLFREPLARLELQPFDCVVFDPPRAGGEAQARMFAKTGTPRVVAVSCNPGTLARDLRILVDNGYEVRRVQPIDQFLFTGHVECVAVLERPSSGRVRRR